MKGNTHFFTLFAKKPERLKFLGKRQGFGDDLIISIKITAKSCQELLRSLESFVGVIIKSSVIETF